MTEQSRSVPETAAVCEHDFILCAGAEYFEWRCRKCWLPKGPPMALVARPCPYERPECVTTCETCLHDQ